MDDEASELPQLGRSRLAKVLIPLIIVTCLAGVVFAGLLADTSDEPLVGTGAIEALIPSSNTKVVREDTIGADLAVGYQGKLSINGVDIPKEQLVADNGLNTVLFKPGPGKVLTELLPNKNCAEITYWQIQTGPESAGLPLRWCFSAL